MVRKFKMRVRKQYALKNYSQTTVVKPQVTQIEKQKYNKCHFVTEPLARRSQISQIFSNLSKYFCLICLDLKDFFASKASKLDNSPQATKYQRFRILRTFSSTKSNLSNLQNFGASVVDKPVVCDSYLILFGFAEAILHLISTEFRSIGFFNF